MKRKLAILLAALCLTALAAGCGASGGEGGAASASIGAAPSVAGEESARLPQDYGQIGMMTTAPMSAAGKDGADRAEEAKRIYTADMRMETTSFDDAAKGLAALVEELGGWMQSSSVGYGGSGGSGYRSGNYTARIPQEKFAAFIARAGALCHVVYSNSNVEDVSEAYYDTAGRLETQKTKLQRLQTLLSQAKDMQDIITIESAISDTEDQIESLSGDLKHYDAQVDYAAVTLSLDEVYQLSNVEQPAAGFLSRVAAALSSGAHGFVNFLQTVALFLAYAWVWALLAAAALAAYLAARRRRKARPAAEQKPLPEKGDDKQE